MNDRVTRRLSSVEAVRTLLHPSSVALVGASADAEKFAGQPLRNLLAADFAGPIHPINPRGGSILGVPALRSIADLPSGVDVGLVMVPAAAAVPAVAGLAAAGVPLAVVAVSGFAEVGTAEGIRLQAELAEVAERTGIRILGPNCNGVYETSGPLPLGYNHTHSQRLPPGRVGLVSHSGAMLGSFVPALAALGHGLSAFVSCGNEVDLDLVDVASYLLDDPGTDVVALIVDGVSDGAAFRELARRAAASGKPLVALKLGNSDRGGTATRAHSSRLAGAARTYSAVFAADGVVSVPTLETLVAACAVLAEGRRPEHPGIVGMSPSGAGAILLADLISARPAVQLPELAPRTRDAMAETAGFAQVLNPFDIGAAGSATIEANLAALAGDPAAGTLIVYLTPLPTASWRQRLAAGIAGIAAARPALPILVVSPPLDAEEAAIYRSAGVPVLSSLLDVVATTEALCAALAGSSPVGSGRSRSDTAGPDVVEGARGDRTLSEYDGKALLARHGIRFPAELLAATVDEAVGAADRLGYPVVLKATGTALAHKTEGGLVVAGAVDQDAVRTAFTDLNARGRAADPAGYQGVLVAERVPDGVDAVVGITVDPDFGPLVLVGSGGVLTELIDDVALAPAPVDADGARALIARTALDRRLDGYRGGPAYDRAALVRTVVDLSEAAGAIATPGELVAIDLNPVRVTADGGARALDALVVHGDAVRGAGGAAVNESAVRR